MDAAQSPALTFCLPACLSVSLCLPACLSFLTLTPSFYFSWSLSFSLCISVTLFLCVCCLWLSVSLSLCLSVSLSLCLHLSLSLSLSIYIISLSQCFWPCLSVPLHLSHCPLPACLFYKPQTFWFSHAVCTFLCATCSALHRYLSLWHAFTHKEKECQFANDLNWEFEKIVHRANQWVKEMRARDENTEGNHGHIKRLNAMRAID